MSYSRVPAFRLRASEIALIIVVGIFSAGYWLGVAAVPFHPDESTYLFMSADWEALFSRPFSLAWQPEITDPRQLYRLLDAPLSRNLIGASRWIAGLPALPADWNWSLNWEQNRLAGALPDAGLLSAGRFGEAVLFPLSLLLLYLTGLRLGGKVLGWSAMLLLAANALVWLHTRRAMAEGGLVFSVCLFTISLVSCQKRPWLIALPAALAFCAKQSTLPMAAIGFLAVIAYTPRPLVGFRLARSLGLFALLWLGLVGLLNPFLWAHPLESIQAAILARQDLLARQTSEFAAALPGSVLTSPWLSAISLLANLYLTPPALADVGNYLAQTSASSQVYLANPLHSLLRSLPAGALLLVLSVFGFYLAGRQGLSSRVIQRWDIGLAWLAGLLQFLSLVLTVTLPFQRYAVPLVPFVCLWTAWSMAHLWALARDAIQKRRIAKSITR
jgi:hypothetical protein